MGLTRVPVKDFRGGLNTRDGPFDLNPNESPDLRNVTLTSLVGQLRVRTGKTTLTPTPPGVIDHCREVVKPDGTHFLMCSIGGWVYALNGATMTWTGALATGTAGTVWDFCQMKNASNVEMVYFSNGVDAPQKWDFSGVSGSAWGSFAAGAMGNRLIVWRNRLVMIHGNSLQPDVAYFSPVGDPEATTGAYDTAQIRGDDDESPANVELNIHADRLYIFKRRSLWVMTDPSTLAARRLGEPGCWNRFQSDVCEDKLYFFNEQGIWSTAGVAIAYESGSINTWFPANLNTQALDQARILATRDAYPRILLSVRTGIIGQSTMIELVPHINFRRIGGRRYLLLPAFLIHDFSASSLANFKYTDSDEWRVVGGQPLTVRLYQYFDPAATTDDGATIQAHWTSSWMAIQADEPYERIRRLNMELSGDVQVSVYKDFNSTPDFVGAINSDSTWDGGIWDDGGQWDTLNQYRFARIRPDSRGRFHQIRFDTLPLGLPFQINSVELAVRGGKEH